MEGHYFPWQLIEDDFIFTEAVKHYQDGAAIINALSPSSSSDRVSK